MSTQRRRPYKTVMKKGELRGKFTTHICKTCGKEFRRRPWGHSSKEYCTYKCEPPGYSPELQEELEKALALAIQMEHLYETDEGFRRWYDEGIEEMETGQMITLIQGRLIPRGAILDYEHLRARVIQPFAVNATLSEAGDTYVATCDICPFFDLGSTPELALQKLLEWFPDELDWYQRHAQELSPSLVEDWQQLQQYVRLIEEKKASVPKREGWLYA